MNLQTPCLHRVQVANPTGALAIHQSLGMSIAYDTLIDRLKQLDHHLAQQGASLRSHPVTFDDGLADVMCLAPHFKHLSYLQPVLFLTAAQCMGDQELLPLPRLYDWLGSRGETLDAIADSPISRDTLKRLPEQDQHIELDQLGVTKISGSSQILSSDQVRELMDQGWLVGSHGADHHDLPLADKQSLIGNLQEALTTVQAINGVPWLAWPEGRCTQGTCELAASVGFELQFSLHAESGAIQRADLIHREIWK